MRAREELQSALSLPWLSLPRGHMGTGVARGVHGRAGVAVRGLVVGPHEGKRDVDTVGRVGSAEQGAKGVREEHSAKDTTVWLTGNVLKDKVGPIDGENTRYGK